MPVNGTDNRYLQAREWNVASGRTFNDADLQAREAVCILGNTVKQALFPASDPIGAIIRLKQISCNVVGLLETKGSSGFGPDPDDVILMPLKAVPRRIAGNQDVNQIYVAVDKTYDIADVQTSIENLLRERRGVGLADKDNFTVMNIAEIANALTGISGALTGLL